MTYTATSKLLDTLTGSDLSLITKTLRLRVIDLERRRENNLQFAAELAAEPERQQMYQEWAEESAHDIAALTALLFKMTPGLGLENGPPSIFPELKICRPN